MENVIIASFDCFNQRRYSAPWVAKFSAGKYDFKANVGMYTGNGRDGEAGDLVVFAPEEGQIYAYGQKDYRGNNTKLCFAIWQDGGFTPCDKLGRPKE